MNQQRGGYGALFGMIAVLIGIAVGISFILIAQYHGKKKAQEALVTMGGFSNPDEPPPPKVRVKRYQNAPLRIIK